MAAPFLQDTPEVAAEKARFMAAFRAALPVAIMPSGVPAYTPEVAAARNEFMAAFRAALPAEEVAYTPEVAAARNKFMAAFRAAQLAATPSHVVPASMPVAAYTPRWYGAMAATIPAGLPGAGSVADTAEVAAEKRAFQQAYSAALAANRVF